ncbi:hypothetical protein HDA31_006225 [Micromonospora carbonacea subsp. aurantiaca]|nr:hypothetical protein [Micromonospora carbonacea]
MVGHAGARLLADVAEVTGLARGLVMRWPGCGSDARSMSRAGSPSIWR